jgi:hypothetical protein
VAKELLMHESEHRAEIRSLEWSPAGDERSRDSWRLLAKDWRRAVELRAPGQESARVREGTPRFAGRHVVDFGELATPAPWRIATSAQGVVAFRSEKQVRVLRVPGREVLLEPPPGGQAGDALALSEDGRLLASAETPEHGRARVGVWDIERKARLFSAPLAGRSAELLLFSPDGRWLVAREGLSGLVFELPGGRLVHEFGSGPAQMGETPDCRSFAWSPPGAELWTVSYAGECRGFDLVERRQTRAFALPEEAYSHFAQLLLSPGGRTLVTQHEERGLVYLWERGATDPVPVRIVTPVAAHTTGFLPDGTTLVATENGLQLHDARTRETSATLPEAAGSQVFVAPGGRVVAVTSRATVRVLAPR